MSSVSLDETGAPHDAQIGSPLGSLLVGISFIHYFSRSTGANCLKLPRLTLLGEWG